MASPEKPERPKPNLRVTDKDLPQIKDWEVGKKYRVTAHVEMQSHKQGDEYGYGDKEAKKEHSATLIIHKIKPEEKEA